MPALRIDHTAGPHTCPICHHRCHLNPLKSSPKPPGRPAKRLAELLRLLAEEASEDRPMLLDTIADRLDIDPDNAKQIIYRARQTRPDVVIRNVRGLGYYAIRPSNT